MSRSTRRQEQQAFARAPIAAAIAALGLTGALAAHAADAPVAAAPAASAADAGNEAPALDAVTVHSRNRIERLQDVPLSVSVTTGAELSRLNAYGVEAIAKRAANISWNQGNQRTSSIAIRGIGKIGQTEAQDPSVGVIVDGVPYAYNALTSSFDFVDVDTVEVARGPQGTLQGKNASVGSVAVNYKRPTFTPTADYSLGFNKNNGLIATAAIGGAVIDDLLAWRGTFSVNRQQGALTNQYNRDQTYTNKDRVSGRIQFLLRPSDAVSVRVEGIVTPRASETTNGATYNRPTQLTQYSNGTIPVTTNTAEAKLSRSWFAQTGYTLADYYGGPNNDSQRGLVTGNNGVSAEVNWKLESGHTISSITAYQSYHFNAVNDEGTPFDIGRNSGGFWNDYHQNSEELRITSPTGGFVDYQAGLFLMQARNSATYQKVWGNDAGAYYATPAQYTLLDADAAGQLLMLNSLANLSMAYNSPAGQQEINNKSGAVYAQANWHFTEAFTVTTGARLTHEDRRSLDSSYIIDNGSASELNPATVNGVSLGGFISNATSGELDLVNNSAEQIAVANAAAKKYFGVAAYSGLTANQKKQVASAKAIRATQIGVVFNPVKAQPYRANQPAFTISPSLKLGPNVTTYASFTHGEKAGISQVVNGISTLVDPEKTNSFELGLKSALLNKTLILNVDVYDMRISNYQQAVRIVDEYTTALNVAAGVTDGATAYTSATGNVPKVEARGLEFDGVYGGIPRTTLRFSGAINLAKYKSFPNSAQPVENGYTGAPAYQDVSGQTLAGASKYSFNIGADYRQPVTPNHDAHVSANVAYNSKFNSDVSLSKYAVVGQSALVDFAIGAGKHDRSFDASIVVKNLFNNQTPTARSATSITPASPRIYGIQFTGTL